MIRAAAKNHADVAVVVEPADYAALLAELAQHGGTTAGAPQALAAKAYARTAAYDAAISNWFARDAWRTTRPTIARSAASSSRRCATARTRTRRAAFYRTAEPRFGVATARQVQGKQLSYNNINDTDAAYECVAEFDPKRTAGLRDRQARQSLRRRGRREPASRPIARRSPAIRRRPSAASSRSTGTLDADAARAITEIFTEVIIAPDASDEAIAIVGAKKNLRLLLAGGLPDPRAAGSTAKTVAGGLLVQSRDNAVVDDMELKVVTKRAPTRGGAARSALRLPRRQAREVEHHRLRQGPRHGRHRRRPDEPRRFRAHRGAQGRGRRRAN